MDSTGIWRQCIVSSYASFFTWHYTFIVTAGFCDLIADFFLFLNNVSLYGCTMVCHPFTYGGTVWLLLVFRDYVWSCCKHSCADFCGAYFLAIRYHGSVLTSPPCPAPHPARLSCTCSALCPAPSAIFSTTTAIFLNENLSPFCQKPSEST